jgi:DNA topoisomerase I
MRVAQQLYEGIDVGDGEGPVGLITYMRTDSINLADSALAEIASSSAAVRGALRARQPRRYKGKTKGAQEAHEAIRPTSAARTPQRIGGRLDSDQRALYELIWKRTVATQMAAGVFDSVRADLVATGPGADAGELRYRVTGQVLKFDGFIKVYIEGRDEDDEDPDSPSKELPDLADGQTLTLRDVRGEQHFTSPAAALHRASLVKELEADGIGRPSTYASIIQTLVNREYVRVDSRRFFPTPLGEVVTAYLKQHFSEVVDISFTARMEAELDEIAEGQQSWGRWSRTSSTRSTTGSPSASRSARASRSRTRECPECGQSMEKVFSGKSRQWFASCHRWPDCKGTLPLDSYGNVTTVEELQPDESVPCPECGKGTIRRDGRFGPFYGCQDYPQLQGHRERRAAHRLRLPEVQGGGVRRGEGRQGARAADRADEPLRQALLRLQQLPGLRLRHVDGAARTAVPELRRAAEAAAQERQEPRRHLRLVRGEGPRRGRRPEGRGRGVGPRASASDRADVTGAAVEAAARLHG